MIILDCGVGFPGSEMFGVDLLIPDFSYIYKNSKKLKAIFISHGHEDHLGALPFLLKDISVPIYSSRLVAGFIEDKFKDYRLSNRKINVFDPDKDSLSIGPFRIVPFRVCHSVPDSVGFAIDTPEGRIFHVSDYKFDWTPVDGKPFAVEKVAALASGGVLALASDSLGATTPGYTESEKQIERRILKIARETRGKIFFTTISSNISRIQQAINVAKSLGRKVSFIGRSIENKAGVARKLGYLTYSPGLVIPAKQAQRLRKEKITYIISGSYGQPGSALHRLSLAEHELLTIEPGDQVIFSSDPAPPGSKANVDYVVDNLIQLNTDVHYYDIQENLHVSGHGSQKDIEMLFALIKPKYFLPIGGTIRHMRAYKHLAQNMGAKSDSVFELMPGDVVEFKDKNAKISQRIPVKDVLVDGLGIGDVGNVVLRDRQILAKEGVVIVLIQIDRNNRQFLTPPELISRGFVFEKREKAFLLRAGSELQEKIEKRKKIDKRLVKEMAINFLEKLFFKQTGRRPMILPVVVEV